MSFTAFNSYQLDTSDILDAPDIEPSNDYYQFSPFNTCQVPGMAQYGMNSAEDLQEVEESKSNARLKLGYKRASSACKQCRHRKIRCIASSSDAQARCVSCVRLKKECSSYLTGQSSTEGSSLVRIARFSPGPDPGLLPYNPARNSETVDRYIDGIKSSLNPSEIRPTPPVVPVSTGIPWTDSFAPDMRVSTVANPANLIMRSQSLPGTSGRVLGQDLNSNAAGFDSTQGAQLSEAPAMSQFSTLAEMSSPSTSSVSDSANPLFHPDFGIPWDSNSHALPMRFMPGFSDSANMGDMFIGGGGDVFDFNSGPGPSTNQPLPLQVNPVIQGRSQSLPYNGYAVNTYWE
ncbi:uncharacterized protein FPRO_03548 [Fusarium proliferatum ET1]|uniref:Zn(2)-C6 fungal-type domain-containing protein n=1 Tax=Fusarium proliferatum (strain ET1) TaxID=1227346 RepID=A0A1L7V7L3_FUSPR|nr:uncharacterized protein FPRO_03548 [Fusarium proliferatum ET1]CZR36192.1 uncharacterized protein FPRO_03548 [Fusarium proliferatum ET1]